MGEIADGIVEGELCQGCAGYMGEPVGYPRCCKYCKTLNEIVTTTKDGKPIHRPSKTNCPHCNKLIKKIGLQQHIEAKHAEV